MKGKRPIKIFIKKLGKERAAGLAYHEERKIFLDTRLKGFELLDTLIHEILHVQQPDLSEESVSINATEMADLLFKFGYRWTDNSMR